MLSDRPTKTAPDVAPGPKTVSTEFAKPLTPPPKVRPQGGRTQDTPDETLFTTIIYVLVSGCAWRVLPPCFGISN